MGWGTVDEIDPTSKRKHEARGRISVADRRLWRAIRAQDWPRAAAQATTIAQLCIILGDGEVPGPEHYE